MRVVQDDSALAAPSRVLTHVPALDGLRGVAVLMVLYHHVVTALVPGRVELEPVGPLSGGFLGVDVFFVLSGFLITALLLGEHQRRGRVRFGSFYVRRALRLLPALYVLLAAHLVYAWSSDLPSAPSISAVRDGLLYVSNWSWRWSGLATPPDLGHLWSLAIEEQFYLVWPFVLVALLRLRRPGVAIGATLALILAIAVHRLAMWDGGEPALFLYVRTDSRADSLLVGALAAQLWSRGLVPTRGLTIAGGGAAALAGASTFLVSWQDPVLYRGGFTAFAVLVSVTLLSTVEGRGIGPRVLTFPPLRAIGRTSYGLYLWHLPVFVAVGRIGTDWGWERRTVTGLAVAAVLTLASWYLVEGPALRVKRRWEVTDPPRPAPLAPEIPT